MASMLRTIVYIWRSRFESICHIQAFIYAFGAALYEYLSACCIMCWIKVFIINNEFIIRYNVHSCSKGMDFFQHPKVSSKLNISICNFACCISRSFGMGGQNLIFRWGIWHVWFFNSSLLEQNGRHFADDMIQMPFHEWKLLNLNFDSHFTEVCAERRNWQ